MATLSENDITAQFIGKSTSQENLTKCAQRNGASEKGTEYIVYSCGFLYKKELRELFGVTAKVKELWETKGTEFNVHVYLQEGIISSCQINKYHESEGARPGYRSLKCTQQDLRIAKQILEYITGAC